jgi:hypothetical protein
MLFLLNNAGVPSLAKFIQLGPNSQSPDFSVAAVPGAETVMQASSINYETSVAPSNGFAGTVSLSVSGLPAGASYTFNPGSINGSGVSTLTITASTSTLPGNYPLTIIGTSGTVTHSTNAILGVSSGSFIPIRVHAGAGVT